MESYFPKIVRVDASPFCMNREWWATISILNYKSILWSRSCDQLLINGCHIGPIDHIKILESAGLVRLVLYLVQWSQQRNTTLHTTDNWRCPVLWDIFMSWSSGWKEDKLSELSRDKNDLWSLLPSYQQMVLTQSLCTKEIVSNCTVLKMQCYIK